MRSTGGRSPEEERTHNDANELTAFTTPTTTIDPVIDFAGNMTTIPSPLNPSSSLLLKYDAWNQLVEVKYGTTVVQANEYDGLNWRIVRDETGGSGDIRHFYYNQQWQVLEERVEVSGTIVPDPLAQYVYHPNYVDSIALRYYDSDTDGTGIVEHYYLQDANFNVTAVTDNAGAGGTDTCPQNALPPIRCCSDMCRCRLRQEGSRVKTR